jgi:hypothetical protein
MTTSFPINNQDNNPFRVLSVGSNDFPFIKDSVEYQNILQYIYYNLTKDRSLLFEKDEYKLRTLFNTISNKQYLDQTKKIIENVVYENMRENKQFRDIAIRLHEYRKGFYYITNNETLWGVNESGYGYNFIGLAYSKSLNQMFSSYYILSRETISLLYKSQILLTHHFQNGHDISEFIGKACPEYFKELSQKYPHLVFLEDEMIWNMYLKKQLSNIVYMEIDYPCNMATFIRKEYIRYFNYYLRKRFHEIMIKSYFRFILHKKFKMDEDEEVDRMFKKMDTKYFEKIANKLFYLYNNPDTTHKASSFLDMKLRKELYEIEIQFKNQKEIEQIESSLPFLFHAPKDSSVFIYDENDEFYDLFEPYTTQLSPSSKYQFTSPYTCMTQEIYTKLISRYGNITEEQALHKTSSIQTYSNVLQKITDVRKSYFTKIAWRQKFKNHSLLYYSLFNTNIFGKDIVIVDSDPIIQSTSTKELISTRDTLKDDIYPITFHITDDIYLQDRLRFRLEDFIRSFKIYKQFKKQSLPITGEDFKIFEKDIYNDGDMFFDNTNSNTPIKVFKTYLQNICDEKTIKLLWSFLCNYKIMYQERQKEISQKDDTIENNKRAMVIKFISHIMNTTSSSLQDKFVFIESLLGFTEPKYILMGENVLKKVLSSNLQVLEMSCRKYMNLEKYTEAEGKQIIYFVYYVLQQKISTTRLEFLSSNKNMVFESTPTEFSFPNTSTKYSINKTEKSKTNKKETITKVMMELTPEPNLEQDEDDENIITDELLHELGLDDDDDDEEINDEESDFEIEE